MSLVIEPNITLLYFLDPLTLVIFVNITVKSGMSEWINAYMNMFIDSSQVPTLQSCHSTNSTQSPSSQSLDQTRDITNKSLSISNTPRDLSQQTSLQIDTANVYKENLVIPNRNIATQVSFKDHVNGCHMGTMLSKKILPQHTSDPYFETQMSLNGTNNYIYDDTSQGRGFQTADTTNRALKNFQEISKIQDTSKINTLNSSTSAEVMAVKSFSSTISVSVAKSYSEITFSSKESQHSYVAGVLKGYERGMKLSQSALNVKGVPQEKSMGTNQQEKSVGTNQQEKSAGTNQQEKSVGTNQQEKSVGTNQQEKSAGTNQQEKSVGTNQQEKSVGTNQQEKSVGTNQQEKSAGTNQQEKSVGTNQQEKSAGTNQQEKSVGTNQQEKSVGTNQQEKSAGTNQQGKSAGTNQQGESVGTNQQEKSAGTNQQGTSTGTNQQGKSVGTNQPGKSAGTDQQGTSVETNQPGKSAETNQQDKNAGGASVKSYLSKFEKLVSRNNDVKIKSPVKGNTINVESSSGDNSSGSYVAGMLKGYERGIRLSETVLNGKMISQSDIISLDGKCVDQPTYQIPLTTGANLHIQSCNNGYEELMIAKQVNEMATNIKQKNEAILKDNAAHLGNKPDEKHMCNNREVSQSEVLENESNAIHELKSSTKIKPSSDTIVSNTVSVLKSGSFTNKLEKLILTKHSTNLRDKGKVTANTHELLLNNPKFNTALTNVMERKHRDSIVQNTKLTRNSLAEMKPEDRSDMLSVFHDDKFKLGLAELIRDIFKEESYAASLTGVPSNFTSSCSDRESVDLGGIIAISSDIKDMVTYWKTHSLASLLSKKDEEEEGGIKESEAQEHRGRHDDIQEEIQNSLTQTFNVNDSAQHNTAVTAAVTEVIDIKRDLVKNHPTNDMIVNTELTVNTNMSSQNVLESSSDMTSNTSSSSDMVSSEMVSSEMVSSIVSSHGSVRESQQTFKTSNKSRTKPDVIRTLSEPDIVPPQILSEANTLNTSYMYNMSKPDNYTSYISEFSDNMITLPSILPLSPKYRSDILEKLEVGQITNLATSRGCLVTFDIVCMTSPGIVVEQCWLYWKIVAIVALSSVERDGRLYVGDIVFDIDGQSIRGADKLAVRDILSTYQGGKVMRITVLKASRKPDTRKRLLTKRSIARFSSKSHFIADDEIKYSSRFKTLQGQTIK